MTLWLSEKESAALRGSSVVHGTPATLFLGHLKPSFFRTFCALILGHLPPRHLLLNYEKVKVCHGRKNNCIEEQKSWTQFEATIWAQQNNTQ